MINDNRKALIAYRLQRSDYAVPYAPSREETEELINDAVRFVREIKEWLKREGCL